MNEAMSENGIVIPIITVALQRPRKMNTTNITNINAYAMVSPRAFTVCLMLSDESTMMSSFTSEGNVFCNSGNFARTRLAICTELPPDCFWIVIIAPCWPSVNVFWARSSVLSTRRATSFRYTFAPLYEPTTMLSISLGLLNSPSTRNAYVLLPMSKLPPGTFLFSAAMAELTLSTVMLYASIFSGFI